MAQGRILNEEEVKAAVRDAVKHAVKGEKRALVGSYRGFEVYALGHFRLDKDGFRFALKGSGDGEFLPENMVYSFEEKFSLSGWFQRLDNFLETGLEKAFQTFQGNTEREIVELTTVREALGKDFPQK